MNAKLEKIKAWIISNSKQEVADKLTDDLNIITNGIISSLDVIELIFLIEELTGNEIDITTIETENISSINSIKDFFF